MKIIEIQGYETGWKRFGRLVFQKNLVAGYPHIHFTSLKIIEDLMEV